MTFILTFLQSISIGGIMKHIIMQKIIPLILSTFIIFSAVSTNAQNKMTDDEIQNVITFAHSKTMGLDHFKYYTGLTGRTRPLNNLYYKVELFKGLPQTVSDELIRYDGIQYFISEESYKKQECIRGVATGCSVSSINYANLIDKISLNDMDALIDDFIEINGEIEDSALTRVLKIVNSPIENIVLGKIIDQVGSVIDSKIDPFVMENIIKPESIDGFKPKQISIQKTIEGHRFYNIHFFHNDQSYWGGFALRIKFSGNNGNKIHLEIARTPVA